MIRCVIKYKRGLQLLECTVLERLETLRKYAAAVINVTYECNKISRYSSKMTSFRKVHSNVPIGILGS